MQITRHVTDDIIWVGCNDRRLALFENLFPIPRGVSYNSYLILDEKTVLMDTVDSAASRQFLENVDYALQGRALDLPGGAAHGTGSLRHDRRGDAALPGGEGLWAA